MDPELQALKAELASLQDALAQSANIPTQEQPSGYGLKQLAFDIPTGVARAGAGLADVLSYPVVKGLEYAGAPVETFGLSKLLTEAAGPETPTQQLVSFLTPSPLSKAKLLGQAGTGLASYLGMKGAEYAAPESEYAGLVGALAGPGLATGAGKLAGAGIRAVSPAVGIAAGSDEALRAAAQAEVLRQAGTEGIERLRLAQEMPQLGIGTGGVPLTAAEIVQTPSLAQYQQEIGKKLGATDILGSAREARGVELQAALERLGVTPEAGDFAIGLRDAAEEAAKKKAAGEGNILQALGLTEEAAAVTKGERGATLREAIGSRMEEADSLAREAWRTVPKGTKLDIKDALNQTFAEYGQFGELAKADVSSKAKRVINKIRDVLTSKNGVATVGELQDIRSAAGRAMAEASGKNPREASLMGALRDNIDNFGIKYFYDPSTGIKGGLPGTVATTPDLEALTKLSKAVEATRNLKQTFGAGVVGEITAIRQFKPKLQTSKVIDRAVASPENASDIINKFGKGSVEATELRLEMLSRLDKATNPTDFLGRNKDTLKAIFGDDYAELNKFAQRKGRGTGLEQFERISDTQIPNKIFADVKQANAFMERFQGTELEQYARAKFITTKLTKSGNAVANLDANKKIAQRLFGADYDDLQKVLSDLELSKAPAELARAASKGQSITSQSLTSLGAIAASRGTIELMKQAGPTPAGIIGAITGGGIGGLAGAAIGAGVRKAGQARELQMDKFVAEMLANPSLIKFAAAPPTEANIRKLIDIGQTFSLMSKEEFAKAQPFVHGTNEAGLKAIEGYGGFIPKTMRYSVLGPGTIYAAKRNTWWFDPAETAAGRMWKLDKQVPVYLKPEAKVFDVTTYKDFDKIARKIGMSGDDLIGQLYYESDAPQMVLKSKLKIKNDLVDAGIDAINIKENQGWLKEKIQEFAEKQARSANLRSIKKTGKGVAQEGASKFEKTINKAAENIALRATPFSEEFGGPQLAILNPKIAEPADIAYERLLKTNPKALAKITPEELQMLPENTKQKLLQSGYIASKTIQNALASPQEKELLMASEAVDPELADLQAELQSLQEMASPTKSTESVKVGKQNISLPTGDKYAPASLVKAVMQVESSGKQGAVSPKGATGLMQLMPGTARDLGVDATDAQQNVEGGSRYLRQMLDKYGDQKLALAAYNWGPGNIDRAIKKLRAEGLKISYENVAKVVKIPSETRNYVNRVIQLA